MCVCVCVCVCVFVCVCVYKFASESVHFRVVSYFGIKV